MKDGEKEKLEAAYQQLKRYAEDLNTTITGLREANRELKKTSSELEFTCQKLEALCEINKNVGELSSIGEICSFISREVEEITRLVPLGMLVLNSKRDGLSLYREGVREDAGELLLEPVASLGEPETLTGYGLSSYDSLHNFSGEDALVLVPVIHEGRETVAALALLSPGQEPRSEDVHITGLILSQTAGALKRAVGQQEEIARLREYLESVGKRGDIVGKHPSIVELHNLIESIADTEASVLIQGESGTGKELVATRIHDLSSRKEKPFVTVNCAAFPETLLESELFGHVRGAFTGAVRDKRGCFERANRGTIFLDEIGEIPPTAQVKLLRVLQFHEFQRLGDERPIRVDIRVIAATSRDLKEEMARGNFREDLYYRLHVIPIELPPLRERMSDLALLCDSFIRKLRERTGKPVLGIEPAAFDVLMEYSWPGNIRELENVIEHSFILSKGTDIIKKDLPASLWRATDDRTDPYPSLQEHEKDYLIRVLEHCGGNKKKAAKMLEISRSTLYRKIEAYGLK